MSKEYRTAADVLKEKYEDRGWEEGTNKDTRIIPSKQIKPLPLSEEEYRNFSLLLAKLALHDQCPKLCETYFELQRRAFYGNGYSPIKELYEIEKRLWSIGTGEIIENDEKSVKNIIQK